MQLPTALARVVGRRLLTLEKHSPSILFGVGVTGMVGSTVLACRATLKLEETMANSREALWKQRHMEHPNYSDYQRQKDISVLYMRSAYEIVKLYGPAIALGAASVGALTKSHNILTRRNSALTAAYIALEQGFSEYRARVIAEEGPERDQQYRYGTRVAEETDEKGQKHKYTRVSENEPSIYSRFFDQLCPSFSDDPELNLFFLRCQQNYANERLRVYGHVFLNEVYDMIGVPRSRAGAIVGWVKDGPNSDNFIDFGIYDGDSETIRDFVNGREGAILLDFNVDGIIWDLIEERGK